MLLKKLHCLHDQVIKIQCIVLMKISLILPVYRSNLLLVKIVGFLLDILRRKKAVFIGGNFRHKRLLLKKLRINIQAPAYLLDHCFLIIRIINSKMIIKAQIVDMSPQDPHAGRMKGRDPNGFFSHSHQLVDPLAHLVRSLIRERNGKDIPGRNFTLLDHISDPVRKHPGLP